MSLCHSTEQNRHHTWGTQQDEQEQAFKYTSIQYISRQFLEDFMGNSSLPVNPHASASKNVLQDMRKNSAVSSNGKSLSLVNLVTWKGVNESNFQMNKPLNTLFYMKKNEINT